TAPGGLQAPGGLPGIRPDPTSVAADPRPPTRIRPPAGPDGRPHRAIGSPRSTVLRRIRTLTITSHIFHPYDGRILAALWSAEESRGGAWHDHVSQVILSSSILSYLHSLLVVLSYIRSS